MSTPRFIRLRSKFQGKDVLVNPVHIAKMEDMGEKDNTYTKVTFVGGSESDQNGVRTFASSSNVLDSIEEIMSKIEEGPYTV